MNLPEAWPEELEKGGGSPPFFTIQELLEVGSVPGR